ncbi:MAG: AMP-binding protein, partial [Candidatus Taylorbacteria bacterium]
MNTSKLLNMTPLTNLSQAIRQDLEIFGNNGTHWSSDDINNAVNYWKNKLYEAFDGETVGNTIWISTSTFFIQVTAMKAAWELGINVFNQEFPGSQGQDVVPALEEFYHFIKVKLVHTDFGVSDSHYKFIYLNEFDPNVAYSHRDYDLNKPVDENTVAVRTHTSGTTGMPKLIEYTHQQGIDRIHNLIDLHGFVESDIPAHYKILHHSSLFMDYAIPLLSLCKVHHGLEGVYAINDGERDDPMVFFNSVLPYMKENKVTRFLCPYDWGNILCQANHVDFEEVLSIYVMQIRTKGLVRALFNTFNFKEISNGFGCSEFGRMATNKFTKDTADEFELNKYSIINKSFEYEFFPTYLRGRIKGGEWSTTSDI